MSQYRVCIRSVFEKIIGPYEVCIFVNIGPYEKMAALPSSRIIKRSHKKKFDEFLEHGPKFLILQSVSCWDPSRRLQNSGSRPKTMKIGKTPNSAAPGAI